MDINTHLTLKNGLVAYWTLDANMNDLSGNGNNGTLYNTPTFSVAKLRTGMELDGSSQYGKALGTAFTLGYPYDHSVSFWFCADSWGSNKLIFSAGNPGDAPRLRCYTVTGGNRLNFYTRVGNHTTATTFLPGVWYHIAFIVENALDHGSYWAYINGVVDANINGNTWSWGQPTPASSGDIFLGYRPGYSEGYFDGKIDEFACWNKKLTSNERTDLYQGGIGITWDGTFTSIKTHPTLRSGLLAHYKFDGDANDSLGNYNGTPINSPTYATGKIGQAVNLNGSTQYVDLGYHAGLNPDYISVCAWMKRDSNTGYSAPIGKRGSLGHSYDLGFDGGSISFYCANEEGSAVYIQLGGIVDGTWQLWAGVFDGSMVKVSLNGGEFSTNNMTGKLNKNLQPTYLGRLEGWYNLDGCLDEITIHDRPLVRSEIQDIYNSGNGLPYETGLPASGTFASVQSGPWSNPATWGNVNYPGDGSTVTISAGHTVTLDGSHTCGTAPINDTTMVLTINNTGWLKWADSPDANWTFTIKGNVSIVKGGKLSIGTAANPVPATRIATVSMPAVNTTGWKIQNLGTLEAYGAEAYHMADATKQRSKLRYNLMSGTGTTLKLEDAVDWQAGDTVSICNRNAAASFENLVIQSKVDAYTYTVNPTYCHLVEDFVTLVNRNVKFLGYDNAGRGVTIYSSITSATDYSGVIINLSWCSFKYFGRNTSTAVGTQMLYFYVNSSVTVGSAIPDANFKLISVVIDELSNNQPEGTIYVGGDMAFNGTSYRVDGLHFVYTIRKGICYSLNGIVNSRNVTASYSSTAALYYVIFARWGNCRIDGLWSCSATAVGHAALHGFFTSIKNCLFFGGYGIYYFNTNSEYDNCRYSTVHESVVDNCKFYNCARGIMASSGNAAMYGMNAAVVAKNCEFYANYSACVSTYGMVGRIRLENCTFDGLYDYSNTDYGPLRFGYTGDGSSGVLTDAVIANCTFGRYASMPNILLYCDGMTNSPKYSFVSCTVYRPWAITDTGDYNWLTYPFFRFRQFFADYSERWLIPPMVSLSVSGCKLWNYDGSGNKEQFSKMGQFRNNLLVAGSELRQQTVNLQNGKFPLRLVPWSCNVDHEVNRSKPITISVNPNKRITVSLKYKATGEFQRARPALRMFGPGVFNQTRMSVAPGNWETLTVQGDCNPDLTEGIKHVPALVASLVGYWGLNGNALDSHTNALNGTAEGTPTYTAGKLDRAIRLNGTSQAIDLTNNMALAPTTGLTVACWVKIEGAAARQWQNVVSRMTYDTGNQHRGYGYWFSFDRTTKVCTFAVGNGTTTSGSEYTRNIEGIWVHVVGVYNGASIKQYQNGVQVGTTGSLTGPVNQEPSLRTLIGARQGDNSGPPYSPTTRTDFMNGLVDDVCIFNRAITPIEVAAIYRQGRGLRYELIQQYTDPTNVYVVMNAGAGYNEYNQNRPYTERWWPGRVLGRRSIGWSGMVDSPTIRVVTDVDSLAVVESAIP